MVTFIQKWTYYLLTIRDVAKICFVCLKGTSHGDVSFKRADHTIWRKGMAYWLCFGVFLAEMYFECSGGGGGEGGVS